jgi:transketolase
VQKANSGHPGLPLGAAPVGYSLFAKLMKHNPANPVWPDRDRFVLSAGHGSALLYSLLHLTGYDLPLDQLKQFRQWGSHTPGHPEYGDTAGVETTTGPLGQGFATATGMALAERHLAARFNRPGHEVVDHHTYVLAGDGDLMEGVAHEAASLAGHLELGKLVVFYDSNRICLAGSTNLSFTDDVEQVFEGYGWHVLTVADGNDLEALARAADAAKAVADRPSLVIVRTQIGYGSPKQGTFGVHGSPLDAGQVIETKRKLGYPSEEPFFVPEEARAHLRAAVERGQAAEADWRGRFEAYRRDHPDLAAELDRVITGELPRGWDQEIPAFASTDKPIATRAAGGKVINAIAARVPELIGGSADLNTSTETALKGAGDFQSPDTAGGAHQGAVGGEWGYGGRNVHYGVREHAMAAVSSGLALHGGVIPFSATFFTFADYMRPAIRLASLMNPLHLRLHPRQHRRGGGRADPPADRAGGLAKSDPAARRDPARRRQRDGLRLARGDDAPGPDRAAAHPPGPARPRRHRRRREGRLRAGRRRGPARRRPRRHRLRGRAGARGARELARRGLGPAWSACPRGSSSTRSPGVPGQRPPAVGPRPRRGRGRASCRAGRGTRAPSARWSASRTASAPPPRSRW